ncbi:MAG TPA: TetR family transcriptional regulator C-terminal domain-containing protein [Methylomusa anaerophila]|nr:TetR/AcrR family transcriptional regulator [Methylomusa anaerophila]HML90737.1 TetR family transcriptional regulator C-terminal domain-containing protein [Methylomusa anaerophila]
MKRTRRNEHIRERLLDAGLDFFSKQGYNGTGIKEIVDAVGVPKGSFYNYFSSKEDFAANIIRHYAEGYWREWSTYFLEGPDDDSLSALRYSFERMIEKHKESDVKAGCIVGNLGAEISESSEICRNAMQTVLKEWRERFAKYVLIAQAQGTVRNDISAEELADIFCSVWEGSLLRMKIENSTDPLKRCINLMFDKFF